MKHDEANVVVKEVFTRDEIDRIYNAVQNNSGGDFVKVHAQANLRFYGRESGG